MPGVDHTMIHIVFVHVSEALSHNTLANHVFLIVVLTPSVLGLICIHLLLPLPLKYLDAGFPRSFLLTPELSTHALLT